MTAARTALLAALLLLVVSALDTTPAETEPSVTPVRMVPASRGDRPDVLTTRATMPTATAIPTATAGPRLRALGVFRTTGYSSHDTGMDGKGVTRSGEPVRWGVVAVDPAVIPLGTRLRLEGFGGQVFIALDTGGGIVGRWIDVWYGDAALARWHGVRSWKVWVVE